MEVASTSFCAWCGAAIPPGDRFCSRCGRPVAGVLPPTHANSALPLVILIVVVAVVVVGALSAALYVMTTGLFIPPNTAPKPVVVFTIAKIAGGADVLVAGIQPATLPGDFKVNLADISTGYVGGAANLPSPSGAGVSIIIGPSGAASTEFSIVWQNPSGSGLVSQGDRFVITYVAGDYTTGTTYEFILLWNDGSALTSINWQV